MSSAVTDPVAPGSIAIVGLAGRFPGARNAGELWSLLAAGKEATQWLDAEALRAAGVPESDIADPDYVRASLVLPDMEMFDADFFGFSQRDAAVLDPQHRHFLECAWEALEDAGHMPENFRGAIGVFGGCGMQAYLPCNLMTNPQLVKSMGLFLLRHTGNDKDFLCSRVSYLLNLKGPSIGVQTACSTSLVAVHMAAQSLLAGECDMALAGASSIELPHRQGYRFAEGEILSPDGHCRAFDDDAAGTIFGSGAGIVVLRRLEDALRDRDNIYAVIRGSAVNNDGSQKAGYLAPSVDGQAAAAAEALAVAGVAPRSVAYIEAHGTGTPVGDPIELAALTLAYGKGGTGYCGIGSLKTNIGHLDTAAGVASLIKVSLALRHGLLPASLNFSKPNSRIDFGATPFYVASQPKPWPRGNAPRLAAVNSLGVGGTNAHVIVEEPPLMADDALASDAATSHHVLTLSARTPASLEQLKAKWRDWLASPPPGATLADAAFTAQTGRRAFEHRCAIVAKDFDGLRTALAARTHTHCVQGHAGAKTPGVAFMFPGGGAHYPGAGRELLAEPAFRAAVDECFRLMPADAPADLRARMFEGDITDADAAATLERPRYALPALFTLEYAIAKLWESWGVVPSAVIGHSAGEYAAACIAGVMSLQDALTIVVLRGRLFEEVPLGGMLSVDLAEPALREQMDGLDLDIAAINAHDLCIASGSLQSLSRLEKRLADQGIEGRRLHIHVAAHSHLLDGVLDAFREQVSRVRLSPPAIPFVSNLTGTWADAQTLVDPEYWVKHLRNPVRFSDGVHTLLDMPGLVLLEAGPGQGLCALARQNAPAQGRVVLASTPKAQEAVGDIAQMMSAAGALWTRGLAPRWDAMRPGTMPRRISVPTYAFEKQRHWIEPGMVRIESTPASAQDAARGTTAPALRRIASHADWFMTPRWREAALPQVHDAAASNGAWLIFGTRSQLSDELAVQAAAATARVTWVRPGPKFARLSDGSFTLDAANAQHYGHLLNALEMSGNLPSHVVHLWSLDTLRGAGERRIAGQALAFDSLVNLARAWQRQDLSGELSLTVVTAGSQRVADEAVPHPERALALGPCRVIPREMPGWRARVVDLGAHEATSPSAARQIVAEAMSSSGDELVSLRGGQRWVQDLVPEAGPHAGGAVKDPKPLVRDQGVYLITGGLGDIALELASFLATRYRARLALVSRRELPSRASWPGIAASGDHSPAARMVRKLLALEEQGAQVLAITADVADRQAMARAVAECRARFGAVHGVFHGAGVLADSPIAVKSDADIAGVLDPKAGGAQVLHELLPPGDLDVFAVFSSTSVFLGAAGQTDYVAANAFLDALAASRPDGLAIRWGVWGDKGMAARAYGRTAPAAGTAEGMHPLLGAQVESGDVTVFEASYSPRHLWVLKEHAVAGRPVLPGTAYIEIARAGMAVLHPNAPIEIRSLSFEEAMVFDPQSSRLVRTELRRTAGGYDFLVRSRGPLDEHWLEHARAQASVLEASLPPVGAMPSSAWRYGEIPQESALAFGPRWHNIARMQLHARGGTAEIALPDSFDGDLEDYAAHPAMTDMAATFGLHLIDAGLRRGHLYVPLSIARIRLAGAVPRRLISRVDLRSDSKDRLVAFDVAMHTPDGLPIASFEGFSLRGVNAEAVSQQAGARAQRAPGLAEAMLACGIRGEDAPALFERVLRGTSRDLVVSSIAVEDIRRAMDAAQARPAARPTSSSAIGSAAPATPHHEQFNEVETLLADAWSELLGVDEIARDDDFFALGGHSLAAVRLFAKIRKAFAVDLPLATLFQTPTLGSLAAAVSQHAKLDVAPAGDAPARPQPSNVIPLGNRVWSPLVAICRGKTDRRPLFCVHGAGGNVLNFKVLSDRLGADQPFYGLQAQGADGRLPALATIEEMAAQYVEAICTVDPTGPYRLAGYSAGGMIALEMAQQLIRDGASVDLVAMIDTLSPAASARNPSLLQKIWLMRHWSLAFLLDWPGRRRRGKEMQASYTLALEKLSRGEPLPPELVEHHLFRNFVTAQAQYRPQVYEGDIVLFKATESEMQYLNAGRTLGWEEHVKGEIRVTDIAGSHFSMMAEPGVSELIEGLRRELERLDGKPGAPRTRAA